MSSTLFNEQQWQEAHSAIAALRADFKHASNPRLARQVVKMACLKAGATGAASSAVGLLPGLSKVFAWTGAMAADLAVTTGVQRDMALRLFVLHGREPTASDVQYLATLLSTRGAGAIEIVEQIGGGVLKSVARRVFGRLLKRGLPVVEVLGSSATHVVGTYLVARKIQNYLRNQGTHAEIVIDEPDARRLRSWTMLSLGTVVDDDQPKSVKDAFRDQ